MILTLTTTHRPATDLGFLLMKHPDNVHERELGFGSATNVNFEDRAPLAHVHECVFGVLAMETEPVDPRL